MKHATENSLDQLETLLASIRKIGALREKKRGIFYRKASAFLHFHEDAAGLFADLREGAAWVRLPVNTRREQSELVAKIKAALDG
jgi:hypothetical protein